MKYSKENIIDYVKEEDVKFIRLFFIDIYGRQRNVSIMPNELDDAFDNGYQIDCTNIPGLKNGKFLLIPDPNTISVLPWRPASGRVVRMFCDIVSKAKEDIPFNTRSLLKAATAKLKDNNITMSIKTEYQFCLFKQDEEGNNTHILYDNATYMDIAPDDKGENVRREVCLSLSEMDIETVGSYHDVGPGQNKILLADADPLKSAGNAITLPMVVKTIANRNGLYADFSHLPLENKITNVQKIVIKIDDNHFESAVNNLKNHFDEIYLFLNNSGYLYADYDEDKDIVFDKESHEIAISRVNCDYNPYLCYALIINAILDSTKFNTKKALSLASAKDIVKTSEFIKNNLPEELITQYLK